MGRDFGKFVECRECFKKLGSPVLCVACRNNRSVIYEQKRWIDSLEEGTCRFNCRSMRAMFIIGFKYAIKASGLVTDNTAAGEAYDHWKEMQND